MIKVRGLVKSFAAISALRGIDVDIAQGSSVALVGPNGAGKTTFLRILAGLNRATEGRVCIGGHDLAQSPEMARRTIGFLSHQPLVYDDLTADENLRFYGAMYSVSELYERISSLLGQVGLLSRRHSLVRTYSRGMKQRLAIARSLLHNPPVLLLDEPYTDLDQHATDMLNEVLVGVGIGERTLVLTTHDLELGLARCDRAMLLVAGRIAHDANTQSRTEKQAFRTEYRRRFASLKSA